MSDECSYCLGYSDQIAKLEQQLSKAQADLELVSSLLKRTVRHLDWGCVGLLNEIEKALKQIKEKKDEQSNRMA